MQPPWNKNNMRRPFSRQLLNRANRRISSCYIYHSICDCLDLRRILDVRAVEIAHLLALAVRAPFHNLLRIATAAESVELMEAPSTDASSGQRHRLRQRNSSCAAVRCDTMHVRHVNLPAARPRLRTQSSQPTAPHVEQIAEALQDAWLKQRHTGAETAAASDLGCSFVGQCSTFFEEPSIKSPSARTPSRASSK